MALLTEYTLYNIIVVAVLVITTVYLYFKYCYTYWKKLGVPYPEPQFLLGNFGESFKLKISVGEIVTKMYNEMKAKGHRYFGIYFFQHAGLMAMDPDFIKSIMSRDFGHFYDRGFYHDAENDPLAAHLLVLEGQKWKNLRAKLTPTFTSGKLKKMFQTLVDCSLELKDCLDEPIRKSEPVNIKQILSQYTTDVIGSCAFGIECNSFKNPDTEFIRLGSKIFSPVGIDRVKSFLSVIIPSVTKFFKMRVTNKEIDSFYRNLIKDTVEYREKNDIHRNDFLQLLIQLKNKGYIEDNEQDHEMRNEDHKETEYKLTMNELSAQAFIFLVAGFETSATTMTWTMFELSQNKEVQNKLREEIVRVLKKHNGQITYDAIMEMHYMERVVQETLRKFPPVPLLQRVVTTDYTIPDTNIFLKKGTPVFIPIISIQNDSEFYPEPEKFDPDRFTAENKATRPDYTWLPFGEGPRICIGVRFAMMQVKVGLCQLLLNYKFTLDPKTVNPPIMEPTAFILTAKDTILLNAERVAS